MREVRVDGEDTSLKLKYFTFTEIKMTLNLIFWRLLKHLPRKKNRPPTLHGHLPPKSQQLWMSFASFLGQVERKKASKDRVVSGLACQSNLKVHRLDRYGGQMSCNNL